MFKSTEKNSFNKGLLISCVVGALVVFYFAFAFATASERGDWSLFGTQLTLDLIVHVITPSVMMDPSGLNATSFGWAFLIDIIVIGIFMVVYLDGRRHESDMHGVEQGSADWMFNVNSKNEGSGRNDLKKEPKEAKHYRETMMSPEYTDNIMFDNTYGISMDTRKTLRNLHMLVVGGSGAGKTRFFIKPNILQMNASYIITDPSGELYRDMGQMLKDNHYDVRVFNTFETNHSMQYNPLSYIRSDADVMALVTTLVKNTGEATGDNKYFDDATKLLLNAIILFLWYYCPPEEQNFSHVMQLVVAADVDEGERNPKSDLDRIFEQVERVDPYGLALKMYKSFKSTSGKSLKSVLSSTATRLTVFNFAEIERLTCDDTISLDTIGDEKTALFVITPPTDNGFNFLVAMMYSQLFSRLYYHGQFECKYLLTDNKYIAKPFEKEEDALEIKDLLMKQKHTKEKLVRYEFDKRTEKYVMFEESTGKQLLKGIREETMERFKNTPEEFEVKQNGNEKAGLPFHVRMLLDEFANLGEIPDFLQILSTIRKYNISCVIVLQALSQLKKNYEKDYETIIGNCDSFVFLGANDQDTLKYVSEKLGSKTITVKGSNESMGKNRSNGNNYGQQKRELLTAEEVGRLDNDQQIVMVRGFHPMRIYKYKLEQHPNYPLCADATGKQLLIQDEIDLTEKWNRMHPETNEEDQMSQSDINEKARKPMEEWKKSYTGTTSNKQNRRGFNRESGEDSEDSFVF